MRKLFAHILVLTFALLIVGISLINYLTVNNPHFRVLGASLISVTSTPTPTVESRVNYYLAYPGILPDHPLYSLKMIRDRISLALTTDEVKKAEKMLLYADKRLGAAKVLIEGNKADLGLTTLTKAEKYLEQAAGQVQNAKKSGKETGTIQESLKTASLKHKEVIEDLVLRVSDPAKTAISETLKYPKQVLDLLTNGSF